MSIINNLQKVNLLLWHNENDNNMVIVINPLGNGIDIIKSILEDHSR